MKLRSMLRGTTLSMLILLLMGAAPRSLETSSSDCLQQSAQAMATALALYGYEYRSNYDKGYLREGESTVLTKTLYSGNDYAIMAGGCQDVYDVDIYIYDENYNLIARDEESDEVALVEVSPRWNGTFYIKIDMYETRGSGANWALVTGYQ